MKIIAKKKAEGTLNTFHSISLTDPSTNRPTNEVGGGRHKQNTKNLRNDGSQSSVIEKHATQKQGRSTQITSTVVQKTLTVGPYSGSGGACWYLTSTNTCCRRPNPVRPSLLGFSADWRRPTAASCKRPSNKARQWKGEEEGRKFREYHRIIRMYN